MLRSRSKPSDIAILKQGSYALQLGHTYYINNWKVNNPKRLFLPGLGTRMLSPGLAKTEMQRSMEDEHPLHKMTSSAVMLEISLKNEVNT